MNDVFERAGMHVFERGWLSSNNILFSGSSAEGAVLVDSGYHSHSAQTVALVRARLGDFPLSRVINTHLHSDHCGGNAELQRLFGCAIDVPAGDADKVDRWDESALTFVDTGQGCPRFAKTGVLRGGDQIRLGPLDWSVIAAPGHDPESVVLFQRDLRLLISADALWQNGFGVVFPEIEGEHAFYIVRETLEDLAGLDVDVVVPGHGSPFDNIKDALSRARSRLDSFVADPRKHARHAAKVLIKFHLLEVQAKQYGELIQWMVSTRYLNLVHERYFVNVSFTAWSDELICELVASASIRAQGDWLLDH